MSWYGIPGELPQNTNFPEAPARALSDKNSLPLSAWRQDFGVNRDYPYIALLPEIEKITVEVVKQREYICVYDMKTEKPDFANNGLAILHPSSAPIHEIINGEWTLTVTHPFDKDGRWQYIRESNLIKCQGQLFTVKRVEWHYETANTGYVVATCEAMFYQLCDMWVYAENLSIVAYTYCKPAIDACFAAAETHDESYMTRYAFEWDSDWQFTGAWYPTISGDGCTPVELLLGSGGIIDQKGGELYRNNFYFSINQRMEGARDNSFDIRIGLNLLGIVRTVDASQLCLIMRLKDTRTGAWGAVSYDGRAWPSFQFPHNVPRSDTVTFSEEAYAAVEAGTVDIFDLIFPELFARFAKTSTPVICYDVNLRDVKNNPDFEELNPHYRYKVGDTGRIYDERLGGSVTLKITETETDGITGEVTRVVFGSKNSFTRSAGYPQINPIEPDSVDGAIQIRDKNGLLLFDVDNDAIMQRVVYN